MDLLIDDPSNALRIYLFVQKIFFLISQELSIIFQTYKTIRANESSKSKFLKAKMIFFLQRVESECGVRGGVQKNIFLRKQKSNIKNDYYMKRTTPK